ncbi:MAG: hypothetical protein JWR16_1844 [Nevskia sp.]|nr:hypothetical protein [Nevskia sp.]
MARLIDTTVQTDTANYSFKSREEAEAFFLSLKNKRTPLGETQAGRAAAKPRAKKLSAMQTKRRQH